MIGHSFQLLWEWLVHLFCLKDLISDEACSYLGLIDFPRVIMLLWTVKVFNMSRLRIIHRCSQLKTTSSTLSLPLFCSILDVELYPAAFSTFRIILSPCQMKSCPYHHMVSPLWFTALYSLKKVVGYGI